MVDFVVRGAERFIFVGARVKAVGSGEIRRDLLRRFREINRPIIDEIRANAEDILPHSGGLATKVAGTKLISRTRLTGRSAGTRIVGTNSLQIVGIDRGRLRHPLFGNRGHWFGQQVTPEWFSGPAKRATSHAQRAAIAAVNDTAKRLDAL